MTALGDSVERDSRGTTSRVEREAANSTQFYTNGLVSVDVNGYVVPATSSNGPVLGVYTGPEVLTTSAGQKISVEVGLNFLFAGSGFVQGDVGHYAYVVDDNTVVARGTGQVAGVIVEVVSATSVWIKPGSVAPATIARQVVSVPKVVDSAANVATAAAPLYYHTGPAKAVVSVSIIGGAALTANDTDYATITISKRSAAGAAAVTLATLVTTVAGGSWVAAVAKAMTLGTASDLVLVDGDMVQIVVAKAASGVAIPASAILIGLA